MLQQLWSPGIPNRGDMLMSVHRLFELVEAWQFGILYPRLGPHLNFNYGAPLFQFYPPLASYTGLAFYGIGLSLIQATKAGFVLAVLLAGIGSYLFARDLFNQRAAAWCSAVTYLSSPYLMTDVYERGAAAETVALALLPWLFWSLRRLLYAHSRRQLATSAALIAALMLAHNNTAIFFVPAAAAYVGVLGLRDQQWRGLTLVALAGGLGLGLSTFYWMPALLEVRFTRTAEYMLGDSKDVRNNLLTWQQLVQPTWIFAYTGETRFHFARWLTLLGLLSVLTWPFQVRRLRGELLLLAAGWLVILFLQLESARPFWDGLPLVRFIQFSWRLYGLASLCVAMLVGSLISWLPWAERWRWPVAVALGLACIGVSLPNLKPSLFPLWYEIDDADLDTLDLFARARQGYALFSDYSPIDMNTTSSGFTMPRPIGAPLLPPLPVAPTLRVEVEHPVYLQLAVDAPQPFPLRVDRLFFPGWQVRVDGQPVPTAASGHFGLVTAELPAGRYTATVQFEQTAVRRLADGLALAALVVWSGLLIPRIRRAWLVRGGLALLIIALAVYLQTRPKPARYPVSLPVNFQDQVHLLGYDWEQSTWRPGATIRLRLYWLAQQTPPVNYKILLHLVELDDSGKVAQADSEPTLGYIPMTNWEPGNVVSDEHWLPLEPTIKPGRYQLLVGVYHPETLQNLSVQGAPRVLPGDRVVLTAVEIVDE
jgi:hypothetical protein